jgi:hypothetical protein
MKNYTRRLERLENSGEPEDPERLALAEKWFPFWRNEPRWNNDADAWEMSWRTAGFILAQREMDIGQPRSSAPPMTPRREDM